MRLKFLTTIHDIREQTEILRGTKDAEGNSHLETKSAGFFATIGAPPVGLYIGPLNPGLRPGPVTIIIEQEDKE